MDNQKEKLQYKPSKYLSDVLQSPRVFLGCFWDVPGTRATLKRRPRCRARPVRAWPTELVSVAAAQANSERLHLCTTLFACQQTRWTLKCVDFPRPNWRLPWPPHRLYRRHRTWGRRRSLRPLPSGHPSPASLFRAATASARSNSVVFCGH